MLFDLLMHVLSQQGPAKLERSAQLIDVCTLYNWQIDEVVRSITRSVSTVQVHGRYLFGRVGSRRGRPADHCCYCYHPTNSFGDLYFTDQCDLAFGTANEWASSSSWELRKQGEREKDSWVASLEWDRQLRWAHYVHGNQTEAHARTPSVLRNKWLTLWFKIY